ncbi:MAG: response regulator [Phycisphaerales bacterium]|nr:response regulator [Phycisphaerales bacterium]
MGRRQIRPDEASPAGAPDWGSCVPAAEGSPAATANLGGSYDFFTNFGAYQPRTHCLQTASGGVDWFWVLLLVTLTIGVTAGYSRIFMFLRRAYLAEAPDDRNHKLMQLSWIFLWCSICGYVLSAVMFVWPAYRLLALALVGLNFWTWRFVWNLGDFGISMKAKRLERELRESLESRTRELERLVAQRTEELVAAKAKAEEANRTKSLFLANISHEIRTPLTAVLGYAELMSEPGCEGREAHASTVRRNASHLLGLINDILDMSKIEAGELAFELADCSPAEIADDALSTVRLAAKAKGLQTELVVSEGVPDRVRTDAVRLRQILVNLVSNSVKFTPSGSIEVRLSWDEGAGVLECRVKDTGIGIAPDQVERVFDPFTQVDGSLTRTQPGSGLGLYISRSLARSLGGDLAVCSTPGVGTEMVATIMPGRAESAAEERVGRAVAWTGGELRGRVLLVDDSIDNRRLLRMHMERAGARVIEAENGRRALERVDQAGREKLAFDLILMDMQMPVMDGREAVRKLREGGYTGPIVALTAHSLAEDRARAIEAGCDAYASKPIPAPDLIRLCGLWMDRSVHSRAA